jgi:microcystin-dependent protein
MSEPFLSEIKMFGFSFSPRGWALCDGQILPINQNQALFSLLGTTYGGDGRTTFALPDLRGRTPVHFGSGPGWNPALGSRGGEETVSLTTAQIPSHTHNLVATGDGANSPAPNDQFLAQSTATDPLYAGATDLVAMDGQAVANAGGGQGHANMQPYLTLNFCIALQGVFPSRN